MKYLSLILAGLFIVLSYQNCGSNNTKFKNIVGIAGSDTFDFTVSYSDQIMAGEAALFSIKSDFAMSDSQWTFHNYIDSNGDETTYVIEGDETFVQFPKAGTYNFSVKAKDPDTDKWLEKTGLEIKVLANANCKPFEGLQLLGINYNDDVPAHTDVTAQVALHECLGHTNNVEWFYKVMGDKDFIKVNNDNKDVSKYVFNYSPGDYVLKADVLMNNGTTKSYTLDITVKKLNICHAITEIYLIDLLDYKRVPANKDFKVGIKPFACSGHTNDVTWYYANERDGTFITPRGGQVSTDPHEFRLNLDVGNWIIRADVVMATGNTKSYYKELQVVNSPNYKWTCDLSCSGNASEANYGQFLCLDNSDNEADYSNCLRELGMPDFDCLHVCEPDKD